jgi:glycosyltransferase involved in cell wall biosynthesis
MSIDSMNRPILYVHIFHGQGAAKYKKAYMAGEVPDESPYGFHTAVEAGFKVILSEDAVRNEWSIFYRIFRKIFGFDVFHALNNRHRIVMSDVIWTMTEGEAFAVAFLMWSRIVPLRPIIGNAVWLLNNWEKVPPHQKLIYKKLSNYIEHMSVHSTKCLPVIRSLFPLMKSGLMYYGINTDLFRYSKMNAEDTSGPIKIFAAGNDKTRDWETLFKAFGNDSRFVMEIICPWIPDGLSRQYNNLLIIKKPSMQQFIYAYLLSDFVVIPMTENIFSGITVALEAAALGKPIICSYTGGVPTYFDAEEVFYVPVGDADAMRDVALSADPSAKSARAESARRRFNESGYSSKAMIERYAEITRNISSTAFSVEFRRE